MEKERLKISLGNVTVEYEFLNMADQDITTELAFPIPPYEYDPYALQTRYPYFTDFRVWVDGQEVRYETEIRAKLNATDYTDLLRGLGIDIETFGHSVADSVVDNSQIAALPKSAEENLIRLGLIDEIGYPSWSVHKTYHWRERFPYILTTANTWRTPIKDFELIVERPETPGQGKKFISFCWDGKVQRLDGNHFVARETNFIPGRELTVYYLQGNF